MEKLPEELEFICEKCSKAHEAKHGKTEHACAFQSFDNEYCPEVQNLTALVRAREEGRLVELPKDINAKIWYHYNAGVWSGKSKDAMLPVIKRGVRRFYSSMEECEAAEAALREGEK